MLLRPALPRLSESRFMSPPGLEETDRHRLCAIGAYLQEYYQKAMSGLWRLKENFRHLDD